MLLKIVILCPFPPCGSGTCRQERNKDDFSIMTFSKSYLGPPFTMSSIYWLVLHITDYIRQQELNTCCFGQQWTVPLFIKISHFYLSNKLRMAYQYLQFYPYNNPGRHSDLMSFREFHDIMGCWTQVSHILAWLITTLIWISLLKCV